METDNLSITIDPDRFPQIAAFSRCNLLMLLPTITDNRKWPATHFNLYRVINKKIYRSDELESPKCNGKPTKVNPSDTVNGKRKCAEVGPVHEWGESMSE